MNGLAADMQSAVPSNFAFDASGTVGSVSGGMGGAGGSSFGTLITIQQMIVRSEDDIRRISQELYNLIQTGSAPRDGSVRHKGGICFGLFIQ